MIASGLVAGVFLTFSDFAMRALAAGSPACGMAVMKSVNHKVYGSVFLVLLLAMAMISVVLAGYALIAASASVVFWLFSGCTAYFIGVFVVTLVCNVPMNRTLDGMSTGTSEAARYWTHYLKLWTRWNHVRTFASTTAAVCFLVASLTMIQTG